MIHILPEQVSPGVVHYGLHIDGEVRATFATEQDAITALEDTVNIRQHKLLHEALTEMELARNHETGAKAERIVRHIVALIIVAGLVYAAI